LLRKRSFLCKTTRRKHPFPVFRTLNAYQWLLLIAHHLKRHNRQIEEVKATPGYPK
jgi:hypothetical protein